ncbi:MAG: isochorismatase family cysteine hydrolase [Asticcacaulis sp.]
MMALPHIAADALGGMLPPERTAVVVIDIQVDFAAPDGKAAQWGLPLDGVEAMIDRSSEVVTAARAAGYPIVWLRVITSPETDLNALSLRLERRGQPGGEALCRRDETGANYYRLFPETGDIEIEKTLYDGFHNTDLDAQLRGCGIDTLILLGMTTECCVIATAQTAFHNNYNVFVVSDATCSYDPVMHERALYLMEENTALLADTASVVRVMTTSDKNEGALAQDQSAV